MQKRLKPALVFFTLMLADVALSQPLLSNTGSSGFIGTMDSFFAASISNPQDFVVLVVAPLVAIYALFKYILSIGFQYIEDNLDESGVDLYNRRDGLTPTGEKAAKLMAFTLSFVIVTYYGGSIMLIGLLSAIGALLWFASAFGSGFAGIGGDGNGGDGGGEGGGGEVPDEVNERLERIEEELQAEEDAEQEAEEDIEEGLPEEAEQAIERAIAAFQAAEHDMEELLEFEENQIDNLISQITSGRRPTIDEHIKQEILDDLDTEIGNIVNWADGRVGTDFDFTPLTGPGGPGIANFTDLIGAYSGGASKSDIRSYLIGPGNVVDSSPPGGGGPPDYSGLPNNMFSGLSGGVSPPDLIAMSEELLHNVRALAEMEQSESLEDPFNQALIEVERLASLLRFMQELEDDIQVLKSEQDYLKKLVSRAREEGLAEQGAFGGRIQADGLKARNVKKRLDDLENQYENDIPRRLKRLFESLRNHIGIDNVGDIQQIRDGGPSSLPLDVLAMSLNVVSLATREVYDNVESDHIQVLDEMRTNISQADSLLGELENRFSALSSNDYASRRLEELENEIEQDLGINIP